MPAMAEDFPVGAAPSFPRPGGACSGERAVLAARAINRGNFSDEETFQMDIGHGLLLAALCVQIYNLGTIWVVQRVIYPLFGQVGEANYITYHRFYVSRIPLPIIAPGFTSFAMPLAV